MSSEGTEREQTGKNDDRDGAGPEGTIPSHGDGVAAGATEEPSSFEPEEDDGDAS
ncbi:hypothetical protein PTW37_10390 [Arthrobacter agilis]|uniref:hypothetical protein n=1 Tax=Arthrobacter agilis TaxID=37921 RepID=UPI000F6FE75C|nr:hypothetical protein [Arthrobacter agilis]WDF32282.1 hypothetical protein PTW37_10390 [Arthrobacter agilis]VDR32579.1 Uncharacterised protein [Arthrobacter agilis]